MSRYVPARAPFSFIVSVFLFAVLLGVSPVPERNEKLVMAAAFALLAGLVYYFASARVTSPSILAFFAAALTVGMVIRTLSLPESNNTDYLYCLKPWAQDFRELGMKAIVYTRSDYNMPYLYIIALIAKIPLNDLYLYKLVSVIFDCGLVVAGLHLARHFSLGQFRQAVLGAAVFLTPTVWLNSSFWGQCDAVYVFFCLAALVLALKDKPSLSVVMAAVALSFKLQTVFFLPVYIILWMKKRVRLREIPVFLGTFVAIFLPAWALGRPFSDIIGVYLNQSGQYSDRLNLNSPSAYALLWTGEAHIIFFTAGLLMAFLFLGALLLLAWRNRDRIGDRTVFLFAVAMSLGIPWLLPSMHERYFYLADVLCVVLAVTLPEKWYFAPFCSLCSYAGYHAFLFRAFLPYIGLQVPSLIILFLSGSAVLLIVNDFRRLA